MKQIITILLSLTYALTAGAQHAVDLGLSVNWADRNIGANRPEEAGIYVAWGELEHKDTYTLDNYRFGDGNFFSPNKYIVETGESQTETDHKRILDDTDDIATYNEDTLYSGDTEGYYWSNELDPYQTDYARTLRFTPRIVHHQNFYEDPRDMGLAVRAVSPRP